MKDGFLKAAALSPALRVADCTYNVRQITDALHKAAARGVKPVSYTHLDVYKRQSLCFGTQCTYCRHFIVLQCASAFLSRDVYTRQIRYSIA